MTTLRDAFESAFDSVEAGDVATDAPSIETPAVDDIAAEAAAESKTFDRARDDSGRFKAVEKALEQAEAAKETPVEPVEPKPVRKAPTSWKKDYWGSWEKLGADPELAKLQDYIEQRESEFTTGVSTYRQEAMKAKAIQDAIAPYLPDMQRYGIQPEQEIKNLLNAHHRLSLGSPQEKLQMFSQLAASYGIPMQALTGDMTESTHQVMQLMQDMNALKSNFGQIQATNRQMQDAKVQEDINAFKATAPHFEEVRDHMAGLLQAGIASDLKSAYDMAVRLNDDVFQKMQAQQAADAEKARLAAIAAKKATAVSTRSVAPTGQAKGGRGGNDIRSLLSASFDEHGGRI